MIVHASRPNAFRINWGHPLSQGLVFDAQFMEGCGTLPYDNVMRHGGTFVGTPTWKDTLFGKAISVLPGGGTNTVSYIAAPQQTNLTQITGESLIYIDVGLIHWWEWYNLSNGTTSRYSTQISGSPGTAMSWIINTSGTSGASWIGTLSVAGYYHLVTTFDGRLVSNLPSWYLNGTPQPILGSTISSGVINSDGGVINIGNSNVKSVDPEGWPKPIIYTRFWNRVLSLQQIQDLFTDPWQIYKNIPSQRNRVI